MKLPEHLEKYEANRILGRLMPQGDKPDGRKVFVKTLGSPGGIPLTAPDGELNCQATPYGLLVRLPGKIAFVPFDAITEIYAEGVPEEDDVI